MTAALPATEPSPCDPGVGARKRSKRLYVLWGVALSLLVALSLFCWLVVVPVWQVRSVLASVRVEERRRAVARFEDTPRPFPEMYHYSLWPVADAQEVTAPVVVDDKWQDGLVPSLGGRVAAARKLQAYLAAPECCAGKRIEAVYLLSMCGASATAPLVGVLEDDYWEHRCIAAWALGKVGPDAYAAVPALEKALSDQNRSVRDHAAEALKKIKSAESAKDPK